MVMTTKKCSKCGIEKLNTVEFFQKNGVTENGLRGDCRVCSSENRKKYRQSNKEKAITYQKKYYHVNKEKLDERNKLYVKENTDEIINYRRNYYMENKEQIIKRSRLNYNENKERHLKISKIYRQKNSERFKVSARMKSQRRRALVRNVPHTLTIGEWEETLNYFNNSCSYCGKSDEGLHQDHFIPLTKGGGFVKGNMIPSCPPCNYSKHNKDFEKWYINHASYNAERESKILNFIEQQETKEMEVN
jgi:hypothetical protein